MGTSEVGQQRRGTGRTSRMIERVIEQLREPDQVIGVVCGSVHAAEEIAARMAERAEETCIALARKGRWNLTASNGSRVMVFVPTVPRGVRLNALFFDHAATSGVKIGFSSPPQAGEGETSPASEPQQVFGPSPMKVSLNEWRPPSSDRPPFYKFTVEGASDAVSARLAHGIPRILEPYRQRPEFVVCDVQVLPVAKGAYQVDVFYRLVEGIPAPPSEPATIPPRDPDIVYDGDLKTFNGVEWIWDDRRKAWLAVSVVQTFMQARTGAEARSKVDRLNAWMKSRPDLSTFDSPART